MKRKIHDSSRTKLSMLDASRSASQMRNFDQVAFLKQSFRSDEITLQDKLKAQALMQVYQN